MFKKFAKLLALVVVVVVVVVIILLALDNDAIPTEQAQLPPEQRMAPVEKYIEQEDSLRLEQLMDQYGTNKQLPSGFELPTLVALSHYPQLEQCSIDFILTDSKGSLYSQPDFWSVLLPWKERKYRVLIDTVKIQDLSRPTLLKNLPYNAQIGVIGHELAHTVSYLDKSSFALSWIALRYQTSEPYLQAFENDTDRRTIDYGLGYQLLAWSQFQHHIKVQEGRGDHYLSPERIETILTEHEMYYP